MSLGSPTISISWSTSPRSSSCSSVQELQKKGVTLQLLWEEYKAECPNGYQYSRFCELYGAFRGRLDLSLRQHHRAGDTGARRCRSTTRRPGLDKIESSPPQREPVIEYGNIRGASYFGP